MDEKELKKRIKNSFEKNLSRAEITRRLQDKGLKLEYINNLMRKSEPRGKVFYIVFFAILILILVSGFLTYMLFFEKAEKGDFANPLEGKKISFNLLQKNSAQEQEIYFEDIEITPDFISYLLNEVGAWQLHKNPVTFEKPIINFDISNQKFYSLL